MKISHSDHSFPLRLEWTNTVILNSEARQASCPDNLPRSRFLHACCLHGQNLYLCGGKDRYEPLKDFWKLDIGSWEWTNLETSETVLPHLQGHTMVPYKSQLFIFGGTFYETPEETPLWIYSPDINLMRKYCCKEQVPRPVGRREHSAVTQKNVMYIFGGFLDSSGSSDEFWAFDMELEEWQMIAKSKPGPRHGHVAVTYSNCMWIHGGMRNLTYLADLWVYNFAMQTWKKVKGLGTCPAISGHTANVVSDNIVIVGGYRNGKPLSVAWIFSIRHHTWRCVETPKEILLSPLSFHASILIDPIKLFQTDADASATSVPHLKTHKSLLPWHQNNSEPRPWTSPSPSSLASDLQFALLDKNNNSEENISKLDLKNSTYSANTVTEEDICDSEQGKRDFNCGMETCENNVICRSKTDILKIRPASYENCCDEHPLLQRFYSSGSDTDFGQVNTILSLSDEKVFIRHSDDDHQLTKSCLNNDKPSKSFISNNCHLGEYNSETTPEDCALYSPNHHSPFMRSSTSDESNKMSAGFHTRNSIKDKKSNSHDELSTGDKENFFTNTLYESLYDQIKMSCQRSRNEKTFTNSTNSISRRIHKAQSSDMIIEDIEFCEEDSNLRNIILPFPSNQAVQCSSLKDLSSFCHPLGDNNRSQSGLSLSKEKMIRSLSSSEIEINYQMDDLKYYNYGKQYKKHSRFHHLNKIKQHSRNCYKISRAYVKHSALSNRTDAGYHITHEKPDGLTVQDCCHSMSSDALSSEKRQSRLVTETKRSHSQFIVQPNIESRCGSIYFEDRKERHTPHKASSKIAVDRRLVLMIVGGETKLDGFEFEGLKISNCYIY